MRICHWIVAFAVVPSALAGSPEKVGCPIAADSTGTVPPGSPLGDLYSIFAGPVDDPDIVSSSCIPVVGREITLSARVRGPGKHPVEVRFLLKATGQEQVLLSARAAPRPKSAPYVEYRATWKPTTTGIYTLSVQVDPENKSGDKFTKNNSASVTVPVTWRELHVLAWGAQRHMKWITASNGSEAGGDPPRQEVDYWHRRGVLVLGYMYTVEREVMKLKERDFIDATVKRAGRYASGGCDGLLIDETGSYPNAEGLEFIRRFGAAYDKIREEHAALRVYNWIAGPLNREELEVARRNRHILMGETYEAIHARNNPTFPRFVAQRVAKLASVNPWEESGPGGIIALGIGGDCGVAFRPQIENSVRLCRKLGPDLPGICYYGVEYPKAGKPYTGSLQAFLDGLTFKYFIQAVLSVSENDIRPENPAPPAGEKVAVHVRVHNIGGVVARNVQARIYARSVSSNARLLLSKFVIPQIGNGTQVLDQQKGLADTSKMIGGTKHPVARWNEGKTARVFLNQALIEAAWTPSQAGYYRLEVELEPSSDHTVLEGFAAKIIPVARAAGVP